ncbi:hypothetical protein F5141DRAFT_1065209 [Pisolithus sp. B1]|nr:hypothetical protein F5141DRAFT_1065209 [Pisolithus sp. B1]
MDTVVAELSLLLIKEIQCNLIGIMSISKEESKKKDKLVAWIVANGTMQLIDMIRAAMKEYQAWKVAARQQRHAKKHRIDEDPDGGTSYKIHHMEARQSTDNKDMKTSSFLELSSAEEVNACYRAFHATMDNQALLSGPCGICARECNIQQRGLHQIKVADIPHQERLHP